MLTASEIRFGEGIQRLYNHRPIVYGACYTRTNKPRISWYRQHKADIAAALPLQTQGRLFKVGWTDALERSIASWEADPSPVNLAVIYIYRPIVLVAQALKVKA